MVRWTWWDWDVKLQLTNLVGLKPILKATTSFSALTLLVGSFDP